MDNLSGFNCMRIYVTGGTGVVGSNIIKVVTERHAVDVFATVHQRKPLPPVTYAYGAVDMCNREQVLRSVRAYDPDAIIHCAILSDHKVMYQDRMQGWNAYVNSTRYLAEAANKVRAKMILISTDWVFDGTQAPADELTPPNPVNFYGVLKVVGETLLSAQCVNWAVARVSAVNGVHWARPEQPMQQNIGFGNFMTSVVETLRNNKPYTVFGGTVNLRATPTLASEIGEMVLRIIKLDLTGIYHCCGGESASRFDLACKTAEGFGLDTGMLRKGASDVTPLGFPDVYCVPKDTSLNAEHTSRQLEYPLLDLNEAIGELRRQMETLTI